MKKVTYTLLSGGEVEIEYDETAPCRVCGLPVITASMGGIDLCPWCDCGKYRNGENWSLIESVNASLIKERAAGKSDRKYESNL